MVSARMGMLIGALVCSGGAAASTFGGNPCLTDCSGHQAGYDWAEQNDIDDEYDCNTPSNSFNEGCQSYVEENHGGVAADDEDDDEEDEE
jgi:hypothetical protein